MQFSSNLFAFAKYFVSGWGARLWPRGQPTARLPGGAGGALGCRPDRAMGRCPALRSDPPFLSPIGAWAGRTPGTCCPHPCSQRGRGYGDFGVATSQLWEARGAEEEGGGHTWKCPQSSAGGAEGEGGLGAGASLPCAGTPRPREDPPHREQSYRDHGRALPTPQVRGGFAGLHPVP